MLGFPEGNKKEKRLLFCKYLLKEIFAIKYVCSCFCNKKANPSAEKSSSRGIVDFLILQNMVKVLKFPRKGM